VKLAHDLDYVCAGTLRLDIVILLRTIAVVFTGRGAR
jgi:lipopolysaccharide/colanic/teichoic acid biosynthesis glycosyltransferase